MLPMRLSALLTCATLALSLLSGPAHAQPAKPALVVVVVVFVSDDKSVIPGNATTHGTGYAYDTQVPLILIGAGISPGHYEAAASPVDIAPTLAKLAGVALPTATGRTLGEALTK